jgi:hypothetical protein
MSDVGKASEGLKRKRDMENATQVELVVRDTTHARSEEVIKYCINELNKGSTWNVLRRKLGLGHSGVDHRWRILKEILCSAIMPDTEEAALMANLQASQYMLTRMEHFIEDVETQVQELKGTEEYSKVLKVHLDSIKLQMDTYNKRFEYFAKMKELKVVDQKSHGASVIYQNNYFIPRPGQDVDWKDGRPVLNVPPPPSLDVGKASKIVGDLTEAKTVKKKKGK